MEITPKIEERWLKELQNEFEKPYFLKLKMYLKEELKTQTIFPSNKNIFTAFNLTPFNKVKVVIIGQDPYHNVGQAHGLSFSVMDNVQLPPSLKNIFKELKDDLNIPISTNGNLTSWSKQGVLLLNATLTVRAHQAGSHQKQGWEAFTDAVIKNISDEKKGVVFLLWGRFAQNKSNLIDENKHFILKAAHPSPFSAHNGFFGCKHFSKTNAILKKQGLEEINWKLNS